MADRVTVFRSPEDAALYDEAYEAMLAQWPVPYTELYIDTQFGETHVIASGSADFPPLVLLHSAGSGAAQWFRNVGAFSERYRTYAVDVIGEVNRSLTTRRLSTREHFLDWMIELLDGLRIQRAHMVGNSFGGMLAFNTSLYRPERVGRVVLISPAAVFMEIWPFYWHLAFPYKLGYTLGSARIILSGFDWIWADFPRDDCLKRYMQIGKTSGFPTNQLRPPVYTDDELRQIRTPMLLLIGDHEVIYDPARVIRRATALVAGLRAEIIPRANHNAQVTAPEAVNRKIIDFLAEEEVA
jgi:pimeloyl-ACP methyl ester carboxylesterase